MATTPIKYKENGFWSKEIVMTLSLLIIVDSIDKFDKFKIKETKVDELKLKFINDANFISWGGSILVIDEYLEIIDNETFIKLVECSLDNFFEIANSKLYLKEINLKYLKSIEMNKMEFESWVVTDTIKNLILIKLLINELLNIQLNTELHLY